MRPRKPKRLDALLILARASGGRRKRQSLIALLVILALLLVVGVLVVWWVWPGPKSTRPVLVVYDQLALPGETVTLSARLEPSEPEAAGLVLSGREVHFEEAKSGFQARATTGRDGIASVSFSAPAVEGLLDVVASYPGNPRRGERGAQARGRVFVVSNAVAVLLVDAGPSLTDLDEPTFWAANNMDLRPQPEALAALRALQKDYRLVYWAPAAHALPRYGKLRAWLESGSMPAQQFPTGAVLAPAPAESVTSFSDLQRRFQGNLVGVTGDAATARAMREQGLQTYLVGAAELPEGVTAVSWAALPKALAAKAP